MIRKAEGLRAMRGAAPVRPDPSGDGEGAERRAEDLPGGGGPDGDVGFLFARAELLMGSGLGMPLAAGALDRAERIQERHRVDGPAVRSGSLREGGRRVHQ